MIDFNAEIVPIEDESAFDALYEMMCGDDQYLYSVNINHTSKLSFLKWIKTRLIDDFHDFFLVRTKDDKKICGFVHDYNFSLYAGHCKVVVYIDESFRKTGVGAYAAISFVKYLFNSYPLRKVYSTVYEYNKESMLNTEQVGFKEEGCLKKYRYYNGDHIGMKYYSVSREDFLRGSGRLV